MTSVDRLRLAGSKASATELVALIFASIITECFVLAIVEADFSVEAVSRVPVRVKTGVAVGGSLVPAVAVEVPDTGRKLILVVDFCNHLVHLVPEDSTNTVECLVILH